MFLALAIIAFAVSTVHADVLSEKIVEYNFELGTVSGTTVKDFALDDGVVNDGTFNSSAGFSLVSDSLRGSVLETNGINNGLFLDIDSATQAYTFAFWYKGMDTSTASYLFDQQSTRFVIDWGTFRIYINGSYTFGPRSDLKAQLTDGDWHHVAFVFDGTLISLYIDCVAQDMDLGTAGVQTTYAMSKSVPILSSHYAQTLLARYDGGSNEMIGRFDHIQIFGRALNASDVRDIYRGGFTASNPVPVFNESNVLTTSNLTWNTAIDPNNPAVVDPEVTHHKVYLSDANGSIVSLAATIAVDGSGKGFYDPPGDLLEGSVYLWRIDQVKRDGSVVKGSVWSFKTLSWAKVEDNEYVLWYNEPAQHDVDRRIFEAALPMGNGSLGAMVFGYTDKERILLNQDSLWRGWPVLEPDREGAPDALDRIRQALNDGNEDLAITIAQEEFCSTSAGYGMPSFGASQPFCDLYMDFGHELENTTNYYRELNISNATSTVTYEYEGVAYKREVFCNYPDQVAVIRLTADEPGALSFVTTFGTRHKLTAVVGQDNQLRLQGNIDNLRADAPQGMAFEARATILQSGGTLTTRENQIVPVTFDAGTTREETLDLRRDSITVSNADSVTIFIVGATDYKLEWPTYKGDLPEVKNDAVMAKLGTKSFDDIRADHIADYKALFDRVDVDIEGGHSRTDLPTWERKTAYNSGRDDRGLEELVFQYGRYSLISCSRPGSMPAHLQGLWIDYPPDWLGDYHLNINFQMNYWPAGVCNLSECAEPMVRLIQDAMAPGSLSAQKSYGSPGWVLHHTVNAFGAGSAPGPWRGIHMMEAESGAFICQNIWDVYAFTGDKAYLENELWPILKGAAEFWAYNLQEVNGHLAVNPSYSPEWGPLSNTAYYPTMIVWDLFDNCIKASEILNKDQQFADELRLLQSRIQPPRVGHMGQLMEWNDDAIEAEMWGSWHRHFSHLWAVYPGKQINPFADANLFEAAKVALTSRGDGGTGWSIGWKINTWARLRDGNHSHIVLSNLVASSITKNLWDLHPPFQIDGNFGYTSGFAECLIQSHLGSIDLLPALPDVWNSGSFKGLRARGGYTVDMIWKDGMPLKVNIKADHSGTVDVRFGELKRTFNLSAGQTIELDENLNSNCLGKLAMLVSQWLQPICHDCYSADMNGDGEVNLEDFSVIAASWFIETETN